MSRVIRFTSQKAIIKYFEEQYMIQDSQMSRSERKIMEKLVVKGIVTISHHNVGMYSSVGRSWVEYRLSESYKSEESNKSKPNDDGLFSIEDYNKN